MEIAEYIMGGIVVLGLLAAGVAMFRKKAASKPSTPNGGPPASAPEGQDNEQNQA